MGLAIRTFLYSFVPLIVFLSGGFWAVETAVVSIVHNGLQSVLRENHASLERAQLQSERQSERYLRIAGENAALKAGLQLLLADPTSADARLTVEDQLREIASSSSIDLLFVSSSDGVPLAGTSRRDGEFLPMKLSAVPSPTSGFYADGAAKYQITSVPIEQAGESVAWLSVGEPFDLKAFNTPVVLLKRNEVVESSLPGVSKEELNRSLAACRPNDDCEVTLSTGGAIYAAANSDMRGGYSLRSLADLDAPLHPVHSTLRRLFIFSGVLAFVVGLVFTSVSSRVVVAPVRHIAGKLRESERTGTLSSFDEDIASAPEIRELMVGFNRAAAAIRDGQNELHAAYLECVQSLASALDARDEYTAGHSGRVCGFACAIAQAMNWSADELRELGVGALLHDIGKIGVPDAVLQKPGKLTEDEFELIKQHPSIGRRILEAVHGFTPYLDVVELHHENWDGTGYPRGLRGEQVPLRARLVHVADAYDAMTSDRPYRRGMEPEAAFRILQASAGTQFDPAIVELFTAVWRSGAIDSIHARSPQSYERSLRALADVVGASEWQVTQNVRAGANVV